MEVAAGQMRFEPRESSFRQTLERRQSIWDLMEGLLVDRVDRHLRGAERPALRDYGPWLRTGRASPPAAIYSSAFGAPFVFWWRAPGLSADGFCVPRKFFIVT